MFIQVEQTPNPATLKFIPGQEVMREGTREFTSVQDCDPSPLARDLFDIDGVCAVFYGQDFISVTKSEDKEWMLIKPRVLGRIMEHYTTGSTLFIDDLGGTSAEDNDHNTQEDDDITIQIKEILDTRIRPGVAMDGGDVTFVRFEQGILYLKMQGACAGCPSAGATLKMGIENMMRHFVPEVLEVRAVEP